MGDSSVCCRIEEKLSQIKTRPYATDDRVEIENPGGLVAGMARRDFGKSSVRRNPIIADLFHRMDKVERMGFGIKRMKNLMRDAGLQEPEFEMDLFFRAIFYRDPRYSLKADKVGGKGTEETTLKRLAEGLVDRLAESQKQILQLVKDNPYISKKELSEIIGISTTAIDKNIVKLKKEGLLKRVGPAKGGHWEIIAKG